MCQSVSEGTKVVKLWVDFIENFRKWVMGQGANLGNVPDSGGTLTFKADGL